MKQYGQMKCLSFLRIGGIGGISTSSSWAWRACGVVVLEEVVDICVSKFFRSTTGSSVAVVGLEKRVTGYADSGTSVVDPMVWPMPVDLRLRTGFRIERTVSAVTFSLCLRQYPN